MRKAVGLFTFTFSLSLENKVEHALHYRRALLGRRYALKGEAHGERAAAAAVAPGTRAYGTTLDAINSRIASTPGVKNAATRRLANGNLTVRVQLYQAVAQWTDGEQYYPLSADGTIVNNPTTTRNPNTVVFRGDVPNDISNITNTAHNMVADLDYLEFIEKRRWNLHTLGGITVMLPERDPAAAIASLMILDKNHKILSRDIDVIDMRDDSRILIK